LTGPPGEGNTAAEIDFRIRVAAGGIAMIPCVVLYLALQRYYLQGLMSGAVKG
jgi:multiple sugar transport system permease protein